MTYNAPQRRKALERSSSTLVKAMDVTSTEGHSCIRKAVALLGLGSDNLRVILVDAQRRMPLHALEAVVQQDLAAGHIPIAVAASAGTVNSGAINPLAALRVLCDHSGL